ncbi:uncharacterized protein FIESC28_02289 [Fusarium coffeatum]|uniref:Uncharacterized protein n=1 Tax=Fusarium coffeatum TaxID=231269 RepID=A0A366S6B6_9HYPO|nr:uncharacterized protein FIESC28_02289 [Fusarium coffeatum]RBR24871.1 hypothetical protein FIESC28_02289 [Fusarium coffeatum]
MKAILPITAYIMAFAQKASARRLDWAGEPLKAPSSVFVTWEIAHATGDQIIFVADSEAKSLLTYACDDNVTLDGVSIQVSADETGNGDITVGDARYPLEFELARSGGVVCEARWNADITAVECEVPWTADGPSLFQSESLEYNITAQCLGRAADDDLVMVGALTDEEMQVFPAIDEEDGADESDSKHLESRQCWDQAPVVKKDGNGYPKKWRLHKQITDRIHCGKGDCEMSAGKEWSVTHSASFSLEGLGKASWISGGYSVAWTRGNSQTATCAGSKGQTICVAHWHDHQEYSVKRERWNTCALRPIKDSYYTYSPFTKGSRQSFYCKRSNCKGSGQTGWVKKGNGVW